MLLLLLALLVYTCMRACVVYEKKYYINYIQLSNVSIY